MTAHPLRIAIVGLDHWYTAIPLAQTIAAHPDTELVGIWHADRQRAEQVAAKVGHPRVAGEPEELLTAADVDLVAAFGSVDRNPATCIAAAENGKHILSIKPMARTLDEATRIVRAVRAAEVRFVPAESRPRATPFVQQLRTWATEGRFGTPLTATFQMWAGLPHAWPEATEPGWFADPDRAPGGGWIDHAIYHLDLLRWVFRMEVTKVSGRIAVLKHPELSDLGLEDYGHAQVEFADGMLATIEDTWTAPIGGFRQSMSIVGTEGAVAFDSLSGRVSVLGGMNPFEGWAQISPGPGYPAGLDDILAAVRGKPIADEGCSWRNLAACLAFYAAAATGGSVAPEPFPDSR